MTVQVENIGGDKADNIDIEIVPHYPFSLDSEANALQNVGVLNPGRTATKEFPFRRQKCTERSALH